MPPEVLVPDWPCPTGVGALLTLRGRPAEGDRWGAFNLATHVGDDPGRVAAARLRLNGIVGGIDVGWLGQVHGTDVVELIGATPSAPRADAAWTRRRRVACAILTADCLPVLLCDRDAGCVAAAHCGWRGLADGVLATLIAALPASPQDLSAWIGPGIGAARYPVGPEVAARVLARWGRSALESSFWTSSTGAVHADLEALARFQLRTLGVREIHGGGFCSARDPRFYSHRREGVTGRMAALVWLR
jgi:YfiH family protein